MDLRRRRLVHKTVELRGDDRVVTLGGVEEILQLGIDLFVGAEEDLLAELAQVDAGDREHLLPEAAHELAPEGQDLLLFALWHGAGLSFGPALQLELHAAVGVEVAPLGQGEEDPPLLAQDVEQTLADLTFLLVLVLGLPQGHIALHGGGVQVGRQGLAQARGLVLAAVLHLHDV